MAQSDLLGRIRDPGTKPPTVQAVHQTLLGDRYQNDPIQPPTWQADKQTRPGPQALTGPQALRTFSSAAQGL